MFDKEIRRHKKRTEKVEVYRHLSPLAPRETVGGRETIKLDYFWETIFLLVKEVTEPSENNTSYR
jgi:hypothetical protein